MEAIVPLEHLHRLVPSDPHDRQVVDPGPTHVGNRRMPEVVKPESLDLCPATGSLERRLDGLNGLPVYKENMRLMQVAHFIQVFQQSRQVSRQRDKPRL